eukprot:544929-Amphidinium_carterae.1
MRDLERFAQLEHNAATSIWAEGRQFYVYVEQHAVMQKLNYDATDKPMWLDNSICLPIWRVVWNKPIERP